MPLSLLHPFLWHPDRFIGALENVFESVLRPIRTNATLLSLQAPEIALIFLWACLGILHCAKAATLGDFSVVSLSQVTKHENFSEHSGRFFGADFARIFIRRTPQLSVLHLSDLNKWVKQKRDGKKTEGIGRK